MFMILSTGTNWQSFMILYGIVLVVIQYLPVSVMSSDESIRFRESTTNDWLFATQQLVGLDSPTTVNPMDGFDYFVADPSNCLTSLASRKAVNPFRPKTGPVKILLAITTCKRLPHFLKTASALVDGLGPLPNEFIKEVTSLPIMMAALQLILRVD
jgi:hypothetical protein